MDHLTTIKQIVDEFLQKAFGDTYKAEYNAISDTEIKIDITGQNVSYLIGQYGRTLLSLQHLIRQVYIHRTEDYEEKVKLIIDIDGYKQKRIDKTKELAKNAAEKCISLQKEVTLPSMTAYERHTIHEYIQDNYPQLGTVSIGEEPNRRIILQPVVTTSVLDI